MSDDWIREQARKHKAADMAATKAAQEGQDAEAKQLVFWKEHFPPLWERLAEAIKKKVTAYNETYGAQVLLVDLRPESMNVRGERRGMGATVTLSPGQPGRTWIATGLKTHGRGGSSSDRGGPEVRVYVLSDRLAIGDQKTTPEEGLDAAANSIVRAVIERLGE